MSGWYRLDEQKNAIGPYTVNEMIAMQKDGSWGPTLEDADQKYRIVKQEDVIAKDGREYWLSTVFLGLDMSWGGGGPDIFETMSFLRDDDGKKDMGGERQSRCSTWAEAEVMHERMKKDIMEGEDDGL